ASGLPIVEPTSAGRTALEAQGSVVATLVIRLCQVVRRTCDRRDPIGGVESGALPGRHRTASGTAHHRRWRGRPLCAHLLDRARRLARSAMDALRGGLLRWTRPATTGSLVLGAAADLVRSRPELVAENALLRQQLIVLTRTVKRPRLARTDRPLLVLL